MKWQQRFWSRVKYKYCSRKDMGNDGRKKVSWSMIQLRLENHYMIFPISSFTRVDDNVDGVTNILILRSWRLSMIPTHTLHY